MTVSGQGHARQLSVTPPAHPDRVQGGIVVDAKDLRVDLGSRTALEGIDFVLRSGEHLALVGPNGAGKTTLLRVIAGFLPPTSGALTVHEHTPFEHLCVAYLPQRRDVDWSFPLSVMDVVMMGRAGEIGLFRRPRPVDRQRAKEALEDVGLDHFAERRISELSGGEQQRMFVARALAQEADLFLMDEPLAGLDVRSQQELLEVLLDLKRRGVTVVVSIHDLEVASSQFDLVLLLNRTRIAFGPPAEVFTAPHLMAAYGGHVHIVSTEDGRLLIGGTWCPDEEEPRKAGVDGR